MTSPTQTILDHVGGMRADMVALLADLVAAESREAGNDLALDP